MVEAVLAQPTGPSAPPAGRALPRIAAVGTAVPPDSYTQRELLDEFRISDPRIRSVFLNSAIERRHLTLPPRGADGLRADETQGQLLRKHLVSGVDLARRAVTSCLAAGGFEAADVGYLCCVSSTGFITPGFSALLIKEMGLSPHCSRLDVVGMGCNAGLNALTAVAGWAAAHPGERAVMVCVEACSAAYVFDGTMRSAVVNSLFGDGAAAIAVTADDTPPAGGGPALLRFSSRIIPEAVGAMRYDWDDEQGKFSFYLDPEVPYVVGAHAEQALARLLHGTGVHRSQIAHWLVHSGGKKVVDSVRVNLGLSRHDVRHTLSVLRDYGNVSSGSFLFSYERLLAERIVAPGDLGVLMTMGPGSTIELALLRW
ncbi:3,5-dihydroxyphenylacetyl-CoA synthase DpgA [Kitasatospora sp. NPDC049285]|uniref:3,5-dihydroxyphenylacetyl-CoA synthase DpgA n=1 Tax=Kitasatospora sp. NPDC049285 TaxID=3157096 RepID=UPI0034152824